MAPKRAAEIVESADMPVSKKAKTGHGSVEPTITTTAQPLSEISSEKPALVEPNEALIPSSPRDAGRDQAQVPTAACIKRKRANEDEDEDEEHQPSKMVKLGMSQQSVFGPCSSAVPPANDGVPPNEEQDALSPPLLANPRPIQHMTMPNPLPARGRPIGFLDLAAELRNEIYSYAMPEGYVHNVVPGASWCHEPPLLRTCKQIREEALPMFNHRATLRTNKIGHALKWMKTRKPSTYKTINRIEIPCKTAKDRQSRTLRSVRRALHTFKHSFDRKGLRTEVVKIQMPVFEYLPGNVVMTNTQRPNVEYVWADINNISEFLFREGHYCKYTVLASDVPEANKNKNARFNGGRNTCR